jgi:hypothetical protein
MVLAVALVGCDSSEPSASPAAASLLAPSVATSATPTIAASPTTAPSPTPSAEPVPSAPTVQFARLNGMSSDAVRATRLPLAIMLDDSVVARPQAGFNAASVVYQAPADGGEDRYMLVFQEQDAADVGPVRSGRPYFVRWAAEFRAAFGHYGGDAKTLQQVIPSVDGRLIYDVDALRNASGAYHRIGTRAAPHNAYTSTAAFRKEALRVGAPSAMPADLPSWTFADDLPLAERPPKGSITVPYGRGATTYAYDQATNAYRRSVAGKAQVDAADGKRVIARNVVVLFMKLSYDPQSEPGHRRPVLDQIGTGKAIVFRDGKVIQGTWRKDGDGGLTRFFDPAGTEVTLVRGSVYVQVVPTGTKVTFSTR